MGGARTRASGHPSLHHFVANVGRLDKAALARRWIEVLSAPERRRPIRAWIGDDTDLP